MTNPLLGLRQRREFHGLTQGAAAAIIGVNQGHYRKIEMGEVRIDVHRAHFLALAFDCSIEQLL